MSQIINVRREEEPLVGSVERMKQDIASRLASREWTDNYVVTTAGQLVPKEFLTWHDSVIINGTANVEDEPEESLADFSKISRRMAREIDERIVRSLTKP